MVAILENPEVRPLVKKISVRAYQRLGEPDDETRTELVRGVIIEKMVPPPEHDFLIERLGQALRLAAGSEPYCRQEQAIDLADSVLLPGLAVVAGSPSDYRHSRPTTALLVVEVAITTLGLDREKATMYAEAGVAEYWLVAVGKKAVELFIHPRDGEYTQHRTFKRGETATSAAVPGLRVEVDTLFAE